MFVCLSVCLSVCSMSVLPCNASPDLRCSSDFFVDEKIEKSQKGEGNDVHEDKIHPGHVDLAKKRLECSRLLVNMSVRRGLIKEN